MGKAANLSSRSRHREVRELIWDPPAIEHGCGCTEPALKRSGGIRCAKRAHRRSATGGLLITGLASPQHALDFSALGRTASPQGLSPTIDLQMTPVLGVKRRSGGRREIAGALSSHALRTLSAVILFGIGLCLLGQLKQGFAMSGTALRLLLLCFTAGVLLASAREDFSHENPAGHRGRRLQVSARESGPTGGASLRHWYQPRRVP